MLFSDPRTNDWFLISSPMPGLSIIAGYLYFVTTWGPRYMKHKKPYELKSILITYNFFQVLISTYLVYEVSSLIPIFISGWSKSSFRLLSASACKVLFRCCAFRRSTAFGCERTFLSGVRPLFLNPRNPQWGKLEEFTSIFWRSSRNF